MTLFNTLEFTLRRKKIQNALVQEQADACIISTNVNMFYVAGRILSGYCYLPVEGEPLFFIRRPIGLEGDNIHYIRKPEQIIEILSELAIPLPKVLMLEAGEITHIDFVRLEAVMQEKQALDCTQLLRKVRSVKTAYEIELLKESARLQSEMFTEFPSFFHPSMTDRELEIAVENRLRKKGCISTMRVFGSSMEGGISCVWTGDNAGFPSPFDFSLGGAGRPEYPVGASNSKFINGQSVMVDCGANIQGYLSDQTRTFSIGKLPQKGYDVHQISLEIQNTLSELCKPGAVCEELYQATLKLVEKHKLSDCFMGTIQQAPFVGHGVGLVVNELPVLCDRNKTIIEANMVIAIEPKFVLSRIGAVGTENTYIVRENGLEKITTAPEEIINLQA